MSQLLSSPIESEDIRTLRETLQKFQSVFAAHQICLWEYDIKTGQCYFPDEYFKVLGLDKAGIIFNNLEELLSYIHPDDRYLVTFESFQKKIENADNSSVVCVRCVGPTGQVVWLEDHFFSVQKNKDGNPDRLLSYSVNVTSQYEKEAHIEALEERNRKIIEALPEFIFIFDDNFFITDVLMSSDTVLLHSVEQLKGADGRSIYNSEVSDLFVRNIRDCLRDCQIKEIEYPLDVDDERHYFQARIAPFEGNKVLALIHDIGERVKRSKELIEAKRKAEEADRMKSLFLANMSHEIRTPLNAIVGFSEIISLTEDAKDKEEYISIIHKNSSLLLQLIDDILDLSRIESGKTEINIQSVEMSSLIDEVGKVHELKMKEGVELKVIRPLKQIWTSTDRNRVTQVLFNFLSNAIKNTAGGSITLELREEGEWLKIYVRDTGCGIPEEKIPLIFARFEKLNSFVQGTGLGLPICKSIVERLRGQIDVESTVGEGSSFILCLPYWQLDAMAEGNNCEVANRLEGRKKILIAEDTETNYRQINAFLKTDYTILWVTNGEEAVNSFLRERPDLILMDIRMPVMNGIEATEKIRSMSADIPIIAVTANAYYTEQRQALAVGCNEVVSKPYSLEQLKAAVRKYI